MDNELQKLRIDKSQKANRDDRTVWPWFVVVLLLLGGAGIVWQWKATAVIPSVEVVRVRTPDVSSTGDSDLVLLNATGYIIAAHKIELASKVVGRVAWVGVEIGDKITKGQELVRLEDDEYRARVAQEQGQLDNAKARLAELESGSRPQEILQAKALLDQAQGELINAETNLKRLKELSQTSSISQQQLDDAEALAQTRRAQVATQTQSVELAMIGPRKEVIDAQRATVRQLEGALALAALDLKNTVIRSPVDATILARNVEVGEFVTNGFVGDNGAKGYVVSIADLNDLRVELDISQNDFAKVSPNQPCSITTDAYPDRKYAGEVDLISPEANRQKATVQVRVKVLNPDGLLKPDMNATVSFLAPRKTGGAEATSAPSAKPAFRVPVQAVRDGSVFVLEDGKAVKRAVTTGQKTSTNEIEVRKGLIGGEDVILDPAETLKDGDRVKLRADVR